LDHTINLCLDEFPYLVQASLALPSQIQKYLDLPGSKKINMVICGSSQRMMQGLVLDRKAALYGRAVEILKIEPLKAGWIRQALDINDSNSIEAFSVWGGVPRYWELAAMAGNLERGIREHILDPNGVLHNEPMSLLLDDMRSAVQPYSLLHLIGQGCHRLSELAARLGKPATSLQRPISQLIDLGYVCREVPFGENAKKSRRALYRLRDPFLLFYFRFLEPNRSQLEIGRIDPVAEKIRTGLDQHVSRVWEHLARASVPFSGIGGYEWGEARRWWKGAANTPPPEIDIVATSTDGTALLVGEAKWQTSISRPRKIQERLTAFAREWPIRKGRRIIPVLWTRQEETSSGLHVMTPGKTLDCLQD
jgi:AAA+ ATPase superfamily predicted ATPase